MQKIRCEFAALAQSFKDSNPPLNTRPQRQLQWMWSSLVSMVTDVFCGAPKCPSLSRHSMGSPVVRSQKWRTVVDLPCFCKALYQELLKLSPASLSRNPGSSLEEYCFAFFSAMASRIPLPLSISCTRVASLFRLRQRRGGG